MGKVVRCSIIIYDDFDNVLIAERGKKNERTWGIFGKEIKGKETDEKCINKAIDKDLKCTIYTLENNDILRVFTGTVKEYITCHKTISNTKWIAKNKLNDYNFNEEELKILKDFFMN